MISEELIGLMHTFRLAQCGVVRAAYKRIFVVAEAELRALATP